MATEMSMQQELATARSPLRKAEDSCKTILTKVIAKVQAKTSIIKSSLALGLCTDTFAINVRYP